jgi:hypothetical protein
MTQTEFTAGPNQSIVVYSSGDVGAETAAVPVRHAQGFMAREGSGYETKFSVAVVYANA